MKITVPSKKGFGATSVFFCKPCYRDEKYRFLEAAGCGWVFYAQGIPFLAIRSITDTEEQSGIGNFEQNCRAASAIAKNITVARIRQLEQSAVGEESSRQEAQKQVHRKTGSGSSHAAGRILKKEKRFAGAERFSF